MLFFCFFICFSSSFFCLFFFYSFFLFLFLPFLFFMLFYLFFLPSILRRTNLVCTSFRLVHQKSIFTEQQTPVCTSFRLVHQKTISTEEQISYVQVSDLYTKKHPPPTTKNTNQKHDFYLI